MSDVSQIQQSHPSYISWCSGPVFVRTAGATLLGREFPWYINSQQTADCGSGDHLSHQPC